MGLQHTKTIRMML